MSFCVYRGPNPSQYRRIANAVPVAATFTDDGSAAVEMAGPPDENFDHANFYWRLERLPETQPSVFSANTIGKENLGLLANEHRGATVRITEGKGVGQERVVASNTEAELTLTREWDVVPDASSKFVISDSGWKFAALSAVSPVEFEVPNRGFLVVQILGRAANVMDVEAPYELSPLRRWVVGSGGGAGDSDVPPVPVFGMGFPRDGAVDVGPVAFETLTNTSTITACTLYVWHWNELKPELGRTLAVAIDETADTVELNEAGFAAVNEILQVEQELMQVTEVLDAGLRYRVARGFADSIVAAHAAGVELHELKRAAYILPFHRGFFGTPASGDYTYRLNLPNVRICAAEMFATNAIGSGETGRRELTGTTANGLRTMYGGQVLLQVDGYLAIQNQATPPLIVDRDYSIRDIQAVVRDQVIGGNLVLRLKQDDTELCTLTIPDGDTLSDAVDGQSLGILKAGSQLGLDIVAVPQLGNSFPGRDLSVTIRL